MFPRLVIVWLLWSPGPQHSGASRVFVLFFTVFFLLFRSHMRFYLQVLHAFLQGTMTKPRIPQRALLSFDSFVSFVAVWFSHVAIPQQKSPFRMPVWMT